MPTWLKKRHENGCYAIACDMEACAHYEIDDTGIGSRLWRSWCYVVGLFSPTASNSMTLS